jgi:DNA-binding transcriptional ArsR family regulator
MKLADLPGRVVRPLGDWQEFDPVEHDPKAPVRSDVLKLLRDGVCTPTEIAQRIGKSHWAVTLALRALERRGLAMCHKEQTRKGRGSDASEWVAL